MSQDRLACPGDQGLRLALPDNLLRCVSAGSDVSCDSFRDLSKDRSNAVRVLVDNFSESGDSVSETLLCGHQDDMQSMRFVAL